jgi:aminoglycoside phosphotransferase (APT) family kinase protein
MALTAERLTQALEHPVEDFVNEPLGLFSSKVSRLTVTLRDAEDSRTFICKEPHPDRSNRVGESFASEARFYEEIAPALQIRVPRCHAHADDLLLLEDIDYQPFSWQRGATEEHADTALAALRVLHDSAVSIPAWVPAFADPDFRAALADRFAASWAKNRDALCQWCPQFGAIGEHLKLTVADYYAALASPEVLLHGDAHLENIPLLVRVADGGAAERVVFFDWQGPRRGHPLFDVAYFNVMSFPVDTRRERESNLLRLYLDRKPEPAEAEAYRFAIAARASGIVEMTADWSHDQIDQPGLGWVANRCFSAAVDHRVQDLLG